MFKSAPSNFFTDATTGTVDQLAGSCAQHFNFYNRHDSQITWDMDSSDKWTGLCSRGFIGYQIFVAYGQAFALFLTTTFTVVGYLNPAKSETEAKNPAVEMGAQ